MARQFQDGEFSCVATRCWHATLRDLRGPRLWDRFGSFARRFNDHPSEDNTHVYLAFHGDADQSPPAWDLSWCCRHVEHTFRDDLARLVEFLDELAPLLEDPQHPAIRLELLRDPHLHVRLFRPAEDVRGEVLRHARELDEWRPEPERPPPATSARGATRSRCLPWTSWCRRGS